MGSFLPPQGFFLWPGIDTFLHGSFSFTHGISPSLCQLYIAPQLNWPDMVGDLSVNYQPGGASYVFTDCILDFVSIEREGDGRQVWGLHILDRRWKWKDCGRISGNYNIRRTNGDGIDAIWQPSAMPVVGLMSLCLNAMGEDVYGYDVSQVAEQDFPEVEWDYENPASALLDLCDKYGYRVILTLENQVLIAKSNQGSYLPEFQFMSGATTIDPPNTPSSIVVAAGRTVVQWDFRVTAVGKELDGTIVPIDLLSYRPANGWGSMVNDLAEFASIPKEVRPYALLSVFKWYQITPPFQFLGVDPDNPQNNSVAQRTQVLPILDTQLDKAPPTEDAPPTPLPAWVYGIWVVLDSALQFNSIAEVDSSILVPDQNQGFYPYEFELDRDQGIVKFNSPTYMQAPTESEGGGAGGSGSQIQPAQIYLRTTCNVRDPQTLGWLRAEQSLDLSAAGTFTKPKYVKSDDVALQLIYRFIGAGEQDGQPEDNRAEVQQQAAYMLASEAAKLIVDTPQSFEYPGLVFIDLDGAVQQITWTVAEDGKATTQANRCKEDLVNTPSYAEMKQVALLRMAMANANKTARVKKQAAAQNLTVS